MIQRGDFLKLHYTGILSDGTVFDTTDSAVAKKHGLEGTRPPHPVTICVGEGMLLRGLDEALIGRTVEKFRVELNSDAAFGKKRGDLLRIIPTQQLRQQQIVPHVGLQLNIDGNFGIVRSTGAGRTVVDFNHPLASQDVVYEVDVLSHVEDVAEQVSAILANIGIPNGGVRIEDARAFIRLHAIPPKPLLDHLTSRIVGLTKITAVTFEAGKAPTKEKNDNNQVLEA